MRRWLPADSGSHLVSQMPLDPLEVFGSLTNWSGSDGQEKTSVQNG
nr:MAG TPA: hypothetical protein [Caudoviricetes sp.]